MIFMKNYALIAIASACLLFTSCTNDELDSQNVDSNKIVIENDYATFRTDSISSDTNPVKTNGKDD